MKSASLSAGEFTEIKKNDVPFDPLEKRNFFDYVFEGEEITFYQKKTRDLFSKETEVVAISFFENEKEKNGNNN